MTKNYKIQAVLFKIDSGLTSAERLKFIRKLGLEPLKRVHKVGSYNRYRISDPQGDKVHTIHKKLNDNISLIIEYPK